MLLNVVAAADADLRLFVFLISLFFRRVHCFEVVSLTYINSVRVAESSEEMLLCRARSLRSALLQATEIAF